MAQSPDQIGKYEILRRVGHGGMGTVYLGRDADLDRLVAIKVLREQVFDDELLQRFFREARAAANLRHENIVTVYEVGQHDHQPFMAMEYIDGTSMADLIKQRQPLPLVRKIFYIEQLCAGLHHAHGVGIVHRDIKPANLMIDRHDGIRILDFGIARVEGSGITTDGALIGTLSYMSPEQMLGRPVDFRSDIFSVGAVAYELLAYQRAFPGSIDDGLLQRLPNEDPPPLEGLCPGLPPALAAIVMRALAKRPADRFPDLDAMRTALRDLRRTVDPQIEIETILVPRGAGARSRTSGTPPPSAERRELLERRARQIAAHRDAARAALTRHDLDGAIAACEDALTLDPDDAEALALLGEIHCAKEQREQESRARRERERDVRQRIADAELKLSKGDSAAAGRLIAQVLEEDPDNTAARSMLRRIGGDDAAPTLVTPGAAVGTHEIPATLKRPVDDSQSRVPARQVTAPATTGSRRNVAAAAAAAAVVIVLAGAAMWWSRDAVDPVSPAARLSEDGTPSATPPAPPEVTAPSTPSSAAADPGNAEPPPANPSASTSAPPAAVSERVATAEPPAAAPPPPPTAGRSAAAAPAATAPTRDTIAPLVAAAQDLFKSNDLEGALSQLDRLAASTDARVSALAETVVAAAYQRMEAALTAASAERAADLAPGAFRLGEEFRRRAEQSRARKDLVEAGEHALSATDAYREATTAARRAAEAKRLEDQKRAAERASTTPPPVVPQPPASREAVPTAAAPPAAAAPESTATPKPNPLDAERPGIMRALTRYQEAYRQKDVDALRRIYPSIPRETGQAIERMLRDCRAYDVSFVNPQLTWSPDDPTFATVSARSTYTCTPGTGQGPQPSTIQDVFLLRKLGGEWMIENATVMDTARRR